MYGSFGRVVWLEFGRPSMLTILPSILDTLPCREVMCPSMDSILRLKDLMTAKIAFGVLLSIACDVSSSGVLYLRRKDTNKNNKHVKPVVALGDLRRPPAQMGRKCQAVHRERSRVSPLCGPPLLLSWNIPWPFGYVLYQHFFLPFLPLSWIKHHFLLKIPLEDLNLLQEHQNSQLTLLNPKLHATLKLWFFQRQVHVPLFWYLLTQEAHLRAQRHVSDFYISDFQSGLRALVKTGYGARVTPYVEESIVVDIDQSNRDMSPEFVRWLAERNLSSDDRIMRLKEGYIKEGSTVSVMGVVQRNDNVLMIVPPEEPFLTGCQWAKCILPASLEGIILRCEDSSKIDVIPV
ncbi:putative GDSL esterase/lipase-like [Capsicum annuum]|nr:putative GDSL esterase/lipase-like [Capsicum annuum]KAF3644277.1 putative GDSL esterase/lipase-like [Capsicum annuum]